MRNFKYLSRRLILCISIGAAGLFCPVLKSMASAPDSENYRKGVECFDKWEYDKAAEYFVEANKEFPNNGYIYYYISNILYMSDKAQDSQALAEFALNLFDETDNKAKSDTYLHLGSMATYATTYGLQMNDALYYYDKAVETCPESYKAWLDRGLYFNFNKEDYGKAIDDYKMALSLNPTEVEPYTRWAQCLESCLKDYDGAMEVYRLSCNTIKEYPYHHDNLSALLIKKGEFDEACKVMLTAIDMVDEEIANYYSLSDLPAEHREYMKTQINQRLAKSPKKEYLKTYLSYLD